MYQSVLHISNYKPRTEAQTQTPNNNGAAGGGTGAGSTQTPKTEDNIMLSPEAKALLASPQAPEGSAPPASTKAYNIKENLKITTPRPDISDTYVFSPVRKLLTGEVLTTAEANKERFLQNTGEPLDYILDKQFKFIRMGYEILKGDEKSIQNKTADLAKLKSSKDNETKANGIVSSEKSLQGSHQALTNSKSRLLSFLSSAYAENEQHGIHEYAQEVFLKRSQQELGYAIDLNKLYKEYGLT